LNNSVNFFTFLTTKKRNIHRGELLASVVVANNVNVTQLCKRMGISRGTYYNHISKPDLSIELLEDYGKLIRYDFTQDLPSMRNYILEEPEGVYGEPRTLKQAIEQRNYWRDKYYKLCDKVANSK
jgi:hypothetical protein